MARPAIGALVVVLATAASCTLSREGTLPVEGTGGSSGVASSGDGGTSSGSTGGGGSGGTTGSCGLGFECVPEAGAGQLVRQVTEPFGLCPPGWQDDLLFFDGNNPGCGTCGCLPAQGGSCAPGAVTRYDYGDCTSQDGEPLTSSDGACVNVPEQDQNQARGYRFAAAKPTGGSCEPMVPAKPPLVPVVACALEHALAGGCPAGTTCVPAGNGDTGSVCELLAGSGSCPAGYPNAIPLYDTADDTRVCACACGSPSGGCANGHLDLRDLQNCGGGVLATVPADGGCHNVSGANGHDSYQVFAGDWSGTCAPSDAHSGDVVFSGPQTLCCP